MTAPASFGRDRQGVPRPLGSGPAPACDVGHNRLIASPPITNAAAPSFQIGSASDNNHADAPMPNTGTSNAIGDTVAAG